MQNECTTVRSMGVSVDHHRNPQLAFHSVPSIPLQPNNNLNRLPNGECLVCEERCSCMGITISVPLQ